jgi:DNA-binding transcriptional regulator YiaG
MTKQEFKEIRQVLKLNGEALAKRLGISKAEVLAYETGEKIIPDNVEKYLQAFSPKRL